MTTSENHHHNLVTDFGAVGDGVTDNSGALLAYRKVARTYTGKTTLVIPPGEYYVDVSVPTVAWPWDGIRHHVIEGRGARLHCDIPMRLNAFSGQVLGVGGTVRVATVMTGAKTCTALDLAQVNILKVGDWCQLTADELQGMYGYPFNHQLQQFVQITALNSNMISFSPAAKFDYLSTYPFTGNLTGPEPRDTGGPATLFKMVPQGPDVLPDSWGCSTEIRGLTFVNKAGQAGEQHYANGWRVRLINCKFEGCAPIPSLVKDFTAINCTVPDIQIEMDKGVEFSKFNSCHVKRFAYQSASVDESVIDNCTVGSIVGTARRQFIHNTTVSDFLMVGPTGFGMAETLTLKNVTSPKYVYPIRQLTTADFTFNAGLLTYIGSDGFLAYAFAVVGARYFFHPGGTNPYIGPMFTCLNVTANENGQVVMHTDMMEMPPVSENTLQLRMVSVKSVAEIP